jgi:ABC-2 type transport system permease protein
MRPESTATAAVTERGSDGTTTDASIHDIGYRKYEGERLGRRYARRSLLTQSLRGAYGLGRSGKSKILPMLLFGATSLSALVLVAVVMMTDADNLPIKYTDYAFQTQPLIALYLAAMTPQSVSRDLRFRTIPLYFSRPLERVDYVLAKYGAMTSALLVFTVVPLLVLYIGALLAKLDFADQTGGFALGLVSVAVMSVVYAGIGLVVAALTPARGLSVAAIIGVLIIPAVATSVVQGIAVDQGVTEAVGWFGLASPTTLMDGLQSKFLGGTSGFPGEIVPGDAAGICYLLLPLALIIGSYAVLMRRYRKAGL